MRIMVGLDVFEKLLVKGLELSNIRPTAEPSSSNFSRTTDLGRVLETVPLCATASESSLRRDWLLKTTLPPSVTDEMTKNHWIELEDLTMVLPNFPNRLARSN